HGQLLVRASLWNNAVELTQGYGSDRLRRLSSQCRHHPDQRVRAGALGPAYWSVRLAVSLARHTPRWGPRAGAVSRAPRGGRAAARRCGDTRLYPGLAAVSSDAAVDPQPFPTGLRGPEAEVVPDASDLCR